MWSPYTSRNISKLERIQRRATTFILKTNDDYEQRRKRLNFLSLEQRRFLFDVLFPYKASNGYINIDLFTYVHFFSDSDRYPLRGKDECTLKKNYAKTITFKFSFFRRILDMWNTLPLPIRQATTIASFKKRSEGVFRWKCVRFLNYPYSYFIDCFFVHISVYIFTVLIVCLLNLGFII